MRARFLTNATSCFELCTAITYLISEVFVYLGFVAGWIRCVFCLLVVFSQILGTCPCCCCFEIIERGFVVIHEYTISLLQKG